MKVTQSCLTLCNPTDYIVHGILQARILEWVAFPFSRKERERDRLFATEFEPDETQAWSSCLLSCRCIECKDKGNVEGSRMINGKLASQWHHLHSESSCGCSWVTFISLRLSWVWIGLSVTASKKSFDWIHQNLSSPYFSSPSHYGHYLYPWFLTQEVSPGVRWRLEHDSIMG